MYTTYPKKEITVNIKWMTRKDFLEVLSIEARSFEYPWLYDDFVNHLRQRNCISLVAETEENKAIVGFVIYEFHETTIHLLNFAVHPDYRRHKIGTQMIKKLINKLSPQILQRINVEIRETNLSAQLFFRKCGFKATNIFHKYYDNTPEDAYLMQYVHPNKIKKPDNFLSKVVNALRFL